jgi:GH24 family phage-related lysozyme (muramidase)
MTDKQPIRFLDLFKYYRGGLPHQMAALQMLGEQIPPALLSRDTEWFKVWSQGGKQSDLEEALKLIRLFEGCRLRSYPDPASGGAPFTIGYGTTRYRDGHAVLPGDEISQDQADQLLQDEAEHIAERLRTSIPFWGEMSNNQHCALISFAYNLGTEFYGAAGFSTISRTLREKRWADIPAALMLYRNPGSSVEAGLKRRRAAEGALWAKP